jgi:hypothetical protein
MVNVNPAVTPHDLVVPQAKKETVIRSKNDVISALHNLNPYRSKSRTIDIQPKSMNVLNEHSSDILNRLGDTEVGV